MAALPAASRRALHHAVCSCRLLGDGSCSLNHSSICTLQAGMVVAQVALGITTLLMFVPTGIAATHQVCLNNLLSLIALAGYVWDSGPSYTQ
jgi:heme A synthase